MALESVTNIADLVPTNPAANDAKSQGDDHIRNLKIALLTDFAGYMGAVSVTGTDGGSANVYTVTPTTAQALPAYSNRMVVAFSPTVANTGACTLNVAGLGAKALRSVSGADLVANDLVPGTIYGAVYNGTEFRLSSLTKNYADQLAFNTVLPAQTGNGGKFLRTSGTAASWAYPGISVVNATITANATLVGANLIVPVQMASMGQSVTLPAANTLTVGGPVYVIDNAKGAYPAGIRDNAGVLLMAVAAGGVAMVSLKDASTAAGVWSINGAGLEPGLITADATFTTLITSTTFAPYVALDANNSIHFVSVASGGFAAFVMDNVGKVVNTPVLVDATSGSVPRAAFKISATQAILFYGTGVSGSSAVVLTVSGTSPSLVLSVGAATTSASITSWDNENSTAQPRIAQLSSSLYVFTTWASGAVGVQTMAISVSGTVVTFGAITTVGSSTSANSVYMVYALTATTALLMFAVGSAPSSISSVVVSIVGTTCVFGSIASLAQTAASTTTFPYFVAALSATKFLVAFAGTATLGPVYAAAATVSGTTVSWGAAATVESGSFAAADITFTGSSATRYNPHIWATGANSAAIWYFDPSGLSRVAVLTESAGVVTVGTKLYGSFSTAAAGASGNGTIGMPGTTEFMTMNQVGATNGWRNLLIPHKISGTTITYGTSQGLAETSPMTQVTVQPIARLSQGDYLVLGANAQSMPVFRSNGDVINRRGAIALPNMTGLASLPLPIVSANRVVLMAASQGTPNGTTAALRLLNVEIAA